MNLSSPNHAPISGAAGIHALDHRTWAALQTTFQGVGIIAIAIVGYLVSLGGTFAETSLTDYWIAIFCCPISVIGIRMFIDGISRIFDIFSIHRARHKEHIVAWIPDHVDLPGSDKSL